ncbi:MAG: L-histidine N(alpha)-methyltransferase [Casimicrobiaceae bacterium]
MNPLRIERRPIASAVPETTVCAAQPDRTIIDRLHPDSHTEREALLQGLLAPAACLPPKLFYDSLGSILYEAIVETDEYYPTRTEQAIVEVHRTEIAATIGTGKQWVDLGSGDSRKAERWFDACRPSRYIAADICRSAIARALARLTGRAERPELLGVVTDFSRGLDLRDALITAPTLFHYPGSSIGNFTPKEALEFLRAVRNHCVVPGSGLLIGVDSVKDRSRLVAAYDDALGVTAAFNLNILRHVNRLLDADFDTRDWRHVAFFNESESRIEMHLEARRPLTVHLLGRRRRFAAGERIHTENSYKYTAEAFHRLLCDAGFAAARLWTNSGGDFFVFHAEAGAR